MKNSFSIHTGNIARSSIPLLLQTHDRCKKDHFSDTPVTSGYGKDKTPSIWFFHHTGHQNVNCVSSLELTFMLIAPRCNICTNSTFFGTVYGLSNVIVYKKYQFIIQ